MNETSIIVPLSLTKLTVRHLRILEDEQLPVLEAKLGDDLLHLVHLNL